MTDCERTALYFDGELTAADEAGALAHLAGCAACQAEIGDWMGIEAALSRPRRARARARWPWVAGAVAVAAAAVVALLLAARGGPSEIALAETRPIEARLSAPAFDRHRPYRVDRGGTTHDMLPLAALAALERRGDTAGLVAAHVLGGDLGRARATLDAMQPSAARDSDRAAVALAAHDSAGALELADRAITGDRSLLPARWNRALALGALELPLVASTELDVVAAAGEPGWSDEARTRALALRAPFVGRARDFAAYTTAATALVAGNWRAITEDAVRHHPGLARRDLFAALAVAAAPVDALALGALAGELDRLAGNADATRAVTAVAARNFDVRHRFHARYRALVAGTLDAAGTASLIAELDRAGDDVTDIAVVAILQAPPSAADLARLRRRIRPDDAWFAIQLARREAQVQASGGDLFDAERTLRATAPACRDPAWAMACGRVDTDLAALYLRLRRLDEADARLRAARSELASAGAPEHADYTLVFAVNLERLRDRDSLAAAYLEEMRLRAPDRCANVRFVDEAVATLAFERGDLATARARMPEARGCGQPTDAVLLTLAVGIARLGEPRDRVRAAALIDAARPSPVADLAEGRLRIDAEPTAGTAQLRVGLAALAQLRAEPGTMGELRAWGYATLIGDAGRRGDWPAALAEFAEELGRAAPAGCVVAASSDDERSTAVVRGADGGLRGSYQPARAIGRVDAGTIVPAELAATLATCRAISVIARPPLHGRAELLPASLAWSFVGVKSTSGPAVPVARRVIVSDVRPPPVLGLPALAAVSDPSATLVTGADATPSRVRGELRDATYIEIHAHGIVDSDVSDAAFVALSPEPGGPFALTAADVKATPLVGAPIVVLAACYGATMARYQARRWSLPDAFLAAGARAVIAAATAIPDDQGAALFAELRVRLDRGEPPAAAVAALRASRLAAGQRWAAGLIVFE